MPAPTFVGAGSLGATGNNYTSPSSATGQTLPSGMTSGSTFMVCFAFFDMGSTTSGSISTPSGWTDLALDMGAVANSQIAKVFGRVYQSGDAAPSPSFTGGTTGTSGATGLVQVLAYNNVDISAFPGTPGSVLVGSGTPLNQTTNSVGINTIPGFTPTSNNAMVLVFGGKSTLSGGNPTGFAALTGESLTWNERSDQGSANAGDAWLVIDDALMPTAGAIAAKTFTQTGGTGSRAVGIMFALKQLIAPTITRSPTTLTFEAVAGGANPADQTVSITNTGDGGTTLNWTASDNATWLTETASGTAPSTMTVSIDVTGLSGGTYNGTITIAATGASNTPQTVAVTLTVLPMPVSNNAEGGTDLTVISTANTGGASGDAFNDVATGTAGSTAIFAADQVAHDLLAYKLGQDVSSFTTLYVGWRIGSQARIYGRAYCCISQITASSQSLVQFYNGAPNSPNNFYVASINLNGSGQISLRYTSAPSTTNAWTTGSTAVSANSWFRIEWDFTPSTTAGVLVVRLFLSPDSTTPSATITSPTQALRFNAVDRLIFGTGPEAYSSTGRTLWFDDLNVNTTGFPGPSGTPPPEISTQLVMAPYQGAF